MKKTTRIISITLCILLIALSAAGVIWALYSKFANNEVHAEEIEENNFVNFNQLYNYGLNDITFNVGQYKVIQNATFSVIQNNIYYTYVSNVNSNITAVKIWGNNESVNVLDSSTYYARFQSSYTFNDCKFELRSMQGGSNTFYINIINLSLMYGSGQEPDLETCRELFKANYYNYTEGTTIDLSGFEQYNAGVMSARESMTINTTSANIADNLDNVDINSSYGSSNKALIQGYMVWGTQDQYTNCTALFNLETNFNEGDYFEFEFYTITGADSINLPNISTFYDLQIIAVDRSGNIVPLANVKAQNNASSATKSTFYLPFSTDKLYITTPHKYIIGYNNFNINITTTNLTALSLYSYKDGYRQGRSSGYTSGYNAGIAQQNATLGTMGYIQSAFNGIGSILQIELLPNVPFSLFILLPLMFGLIAFVVKLSKGGS